MASFKIFTGRYLLHPLRYLLHPLRYLLSTAAAQYVQLLLLLSRTSLGAVTILDRGHIVDTKF